MWNEVRVVALGVVLGYSINGAMPTIVSGTLNLIIIAGMKWRERRRKQLPKARTL